MSKSQKDTRRKRGRPLSKKGPLTVDLGSMKAIIAKARGEAGVSAARFLEDVLREADAAHCGEGAAGAGLYRLYLDFQERRVTAPQ